MEAEDSTVETTGAQGEETFITDQVVSYGAPILLIVLLFVVGAIVARFLRGVDSITEGVTKEELEFERQLTAMAGVEPLVGLPEQVTAEAPQQVVSPVSSTSQVETTSSTDTGHVHGSSGVESIARRLTGLGIVTELQGRIPLAIPPEGLIYGLKKGGACGILPRQESAEVMEHLCRRFDILFYPAPDGEILAMERLQSRLPGLLERKA